VYGRDEKYARGVSGSCMGTVCTGEPPPAGLVRREGDHDHAHLGYAGFRGQLFKMPTFRGIRETWASWMMARRETKTSRRQVFGYTGKLGVLIPGLSTAFSGTKRGVGARGPLKSNRRNPATSFFYQHSPSWARPCGVTTSPRPPPLHSQPA